ncbi:GNAT family N-acetyltransferase [Streptosporangium lutulentum]
MLFRPTTEADLDRVVACTVDEPISWIPADRYLAELAEGMYRPQWTWIAEDGDRVMARALWWGQSDSTHPIALDCLYVDASVPDRAAVAAELLTAGLRAFGEQGASKPPLYNLTLPNGWRADPAVSAALAWRRQAALAAGLTDEVERLRFEWTPDLGVPASRGLAHLHRRLRRGVPGGVPPDRRRQPGRRDPQEPRSQGRRGHRPPRDGLLPRLPRRTRVVADRPHPEGAVAGLAIPSATPYNPNVGYLGVVPELRGHGYVDDILAEITRIHAENGAELITATTDTTNAPMAAAFERAGYRNTQVRVLLSAPSD